MRREAGNYANAVQARSDHYRLSRSHGRAQRGALRCRMPAKPAAHSVCSCAIPVVQQAMIVTRVAPSPTGFLHLGHAYAALMAYRAAQENDGRFLLRIEDIDAGRCRPEFEQAIFDDLHWLGLAWEEPVRRQSQHLADYAQALQRLQEKGVVYPCFCTRKNIEAEIARAASAPHPGDLSGNIYPGICRGLSEEERARRVASGLIYALRLDCAKALRLIEPGKLQFDELGRGPNGEMG